MATPIVLLTNDDGFDAPGLVALEQAFTSLGANVAVVAPVGDHTAGSHRITFDRQAQLTTVGPWSFTYSGTPADCVRVGVLSGLLPRPDLVVSGINHGANAGEDIHYSGTVAAAVEAALLGIPAVAVSQDGDGADLPFLPKAPIAFDGAELAARIALQLCHPQGDERLVFNINLPLRMNAERSARWCQLGRRDWAGAGVRLLNRTGRVATLDPWDRPPVAIATESSDYAALQAGHVSVTPLIVRGGLYEAPPHSTWWSEPLEASAPKRADAGIAP